MEIKVDFLFLCVKKRVIMFCREVFGRGGRSRCFWGAFFFSLVVRGFGRKVKVES